MHLRPLCLLYIPGWLKLNIFLRFSLEFQEIAEKFWRAKYWSKDGCPEQMTSCRSASPLFRNVDSIGKLIGWKLWMEMYENERCHQGKPYIFRKGTSDRNMLTISKDKNHVNWMKMPVMTMTSNKYASKRFEMEERGRCEGWTLSKEPNDLSIVEAEWSK